MFRLHAWQSYPFQSGLEVVFTCSFVFYGASPPPPPPPPPPPTTPPESSTFCFTSAEARWLIRDGDPVGGGGGEEEGEQKSEGTTVDTARKIPERPWTAARTMEVLRRCPLAIAQRLVHRAMAVSTAVLGQSYKDNVRCTAVEEQLEAKEVQLSQPSSTSLLVISSGLT